jgi:exopolyphosphatase / guanosine-5'-triphosphate,3'-diphosphate pyrophosphatase
MVEVGRSHAPDSLTVVGTEALRRAPNAGEFRARARAEAGVDVRILSGYEEAAAAFLGVVNSTLLADGYLLDIGGGSVEVMRVQGRALGEVFSAPLGAIYAREQYFHSDPPAGRDVRALRKAVRGHLAGLGAVPEAPPGEVQMFATGGAARNLARIVRLKHPYDLRRIHGSVIARGDLHRLATSLAGATTEQRRRMAGVGSSRVDTLPAAAVVIDEVMAVTGAPSLTVAGQGLREGLVWQQLRGESPIIPDVRQASLVGLARANGVDEAAAEPVVAVAGQVFEATVGLHGYGEAELDLLLAAARLAGIGMHIDYYNRDRHAEYLVQSGDLRGFTHREIVLLSALVRHARGGTPDFAAFRAIIGPDDQRRAIVLSTLLGIAQAVHRRIPSPVTAVEFGCSSDSLTVVLHGRDALEAELYELERQGKRVGAALKVDFVVQRAGDEGPAS